jgi:hypothetical protein
VLASVELDRLKRAKAMVRARRFMMVSSSSAAVIGAVLEHGR